MPVNQLPGPISVHSNIDGALSVGTSTKLAADAARYNKITAAVLGAQVVFATGMGGDVWYFVNVSANAVSIFSAAGGSFSLGINEAAYCGFVVDGGPLVILAKYGLV